MTSQPTRFLALDVFRGLTICLMIVVNTPGNGDFTFAPLQHAAWDGFTPTDLVFPSFLFAVGNAMSFVMPKWINLPQQRVLWKIFRRTLLIFLLGFAMYWFPFVKYGPDHELMVAPFAQTRVLGVLQRIALCYCIASLLVYYLKPLAVLWTGIFFLFAYWTLLYVFGNPDTPLTMEGNAVLVLDRWLFGEAHLYHGDKIAFDPEGLLSTLPAISNVIGGYWVGRFLQKKGNTYEGLTGLLLAGTVLLFAGYCWDLLFPINKKLWTSSFVVLTVGLDCLVLAVIIYITQFKQKTSWTYFFVVFGRNPLFIYLLSELVALLLYFIRVDENTTAFQWIYQHIFSHLGPYTGSLLFALAFMLFCWLVGCWLDKKKRYIRV